MSPETFVSRLRRSLKPLLVLLIAGLLPARSDAWGLLGHRVVGEIADSYLTPKARAEIKKILGNESLAMAANWADFIKSDPNYRYLSEWHYYDYDPVVSYNEFAAALKKDTAVDAYTKLQFLVAELKKKNLPMDKKVMYVRLVIHIVGDIHQPFHAAHTADKGGNDVKLAWFGKATNLHAVWDSDLIGSQELSYTEYTKAINFTTPAQRADWQKSDMTRWLFETHELSEKIYADTKPDAKLSYKYIFDYIGVANTQLLKGGVRLAGVLNSIFG